MKNFIDRLLPLGDPHFERDPGGEVRHVSGPKKDPAFVMMSNCGFPEQSHFQVLRLLAKRMARNFKTEVVGEIYRGAGSLLEDEGMRPFVDAYRGLLGRAGAEVATQGRLSPETTRLLEEPLIPAPDYVDLFVANANACMDRMIAENRTV